MTEMTWRDLADQLEPKQVAELEYRELHGRQLDSGDPRQLDTARMMVTRNLIQVICADIALPSDADPTNDMGDWYDWDDGIYCRHYNIGQSHAAAGGFVVKGGIQLSDGSVERFISLDCCDDSLTSAAARELAAALLAAADELEAQ